jgi:hypothetical protein
MCRLHHVLVTKRTIIRSAVEDNLNIFNSFEKNFAIYLNLCISLNLFTQT